MRRFLVPVAACVVLLAAGAYFFMGRFPRPEAPPVQPAPAGPVAPGQAASSTRPTGPSVPGWPAAQPYSFDKYGQVLAEFVDDQGWVDYGRLKRQRSLLRDLLGDLGRLSPEGYKDWSSHDQIAFWINTYNIQALRILTDNYPIQGSRWLVPIYGPDSIRHINGLKTGYKFLVMDEQFTLGEVEERIFRRQFQDSRVFLALTTLSVSGPPLRKEPYRGPSLDAQLADQARRFLSSPRGLQIDRASGQIRVSALFQSTWHGEDFVKAYGIDRKFKEQPPYVRAVLNFVCTAVSPAEKEFLEVGNYSVEFIKFDWTLNDSARRQP